MLHVVPDASGGFCVSRCVVRNWLWGMVLFYPGGLKRGRKVRMRQERCARDGGLGAWAKTLHAGLSLTQRLSSGRRGCFMLLEDGRKENAEFSQRRNLVGDDWSAYQSLVVAVVADPKPKEGVPISICEGSVSIRNSRAPEVPNGLKVERWMGGILLKESELRVSGLLNGIGKVTIEFPEIARRVRLQRPHSFPCVFLSAIGWNCPALIWALTLSTT
jgi:hypothetical protein